MQHKLIFHKHSKHLPNKENQELLINFLKTIPREAEIKGKKFKGKLTPESTSRDIMEFFNCFEDLIKEYNSKIVVPSNKVAMIERWIQQINEDTDIGPRIVEGENQRNIIIDPAKVIRGRVLFELRGGNDLKLSEFVDHLIIPDTDKKELTIDYNLFYDIGLAAAYEKFIPFLNQEKSKFINELSNNRELDENFDPVKIEHETELLAILDSFGIIQYLMDFTKSNENSPPNFAKAAKMICEFTGREEHENIRLLLSALYNHKLGRRSKNPLHSDRNKILIDRIKMKFKLEK
jgi:hypothetical protein